MKIKNAANGLVGLLGAGAMALGMSGEAKADHIQTIVESPNAYGSNLHIYHKAESVEGKDGEDGWDHEWAYPSPPTPFIRITTSPYGTPLDGDGRGLDSTTNFIASLDGIGGPFSAANTKIKFEFTEGPDVIQDYNYSLISGGFTESGSLLDRINNYSEYTGSFTYNSSVGATLTLTPTPSPSTGVLAGMGALTGAGYVGARMFADRNRKKALRAGNRKAA